MSKGDVKILHNAAYVLQGVKSSFSEGKQLPKPDKESSVSTEDDKETIKYVDWGENNSFPMELLKSIKKSGVAKRALNFQCKSHYGGGLVLFEETFEGDKRLPKQISRDDTTYKPVFEFLEKNRVPTVLARN